MPQCAQRGDPLWLFRKFISDYSAQCPVPKILIPSLGGRARADIKKFRELFSFSSFSSFAKRANARGNSHACLRNFSTPCPRALRRRKSWSAQERQKLRPIRLESAAPSIRDAATIPRACNCLARRQAIRTPTAALHSCERPPRQQPFCANSPPAHATVLRAAENPSKGRGLFQSKLKKSKRFRNLT